MLLLISPAKTLDDTPFTRALPCTQPAFTAQSHALVTLLADYSPDALSSLMGISPALAAPASIIAPETARMSLALSRQATRRSERAWPSSGARSF